MLRRFLRSILSPSNPNPPAPLAARGAAPPSAKPAHAGPKPEGAARPEVYRGLRAQALNVRPDQLGARLLPDAPDLLGLVTDIPVGTAPAGTATLVCMADGTTSLYLSSGGGFIGTGFHEPVRIATRQALRLASDLASTFSPSGGHDSAPRDAVSFSILTISGIRVATAPMPALIGRTHPLAPLFEAVNNVVTQVRLVTTAQQTGRRPLRP
jgi:hypothetical protein